MIRHTIDHGTLKRPKIDFGDFKSNFEGMLEDVGFSRVKFVLLTYHAKPIKCAGYLHSTIQTKLFGDTTIAIKFTHLKCRQYLRHGLLPLRNIRFVESSLGDYIQYIRTNHILSEFLANHFERKEQVLTKFNIITN